MSETLMNTICDLSVGNYRIMTTLANELMETSLRESCPTWMKNFILRSNVKALLIP